MQIRYHTLPMEPDRSQRNAILMTRATHASVTVAVLLSLFKLGAFLLTGSVAMLATLIDSLLDAASSIVNMVAVRHALTPADREHRFGHGKAEALAGLWQAAFISGSALFLVFQAGDRLLHPQAVRHTELGIGVMVVATLATILLVLYQRHVVRETGSLAIGADSLHYLTDVLANLGVIAALALSTWAGWEAADPLFAIAVAAYVFASAWQIARRSLDQLMDRELDDREREQIRRIALSHPKVEDLHELRTRVAGQTVFIQMHLEMDGNMPLHEAHAIVVEVMERLQRAYPNAEIIIHEDPAGLEEVAERHD